MSLVSYIIQNMILAQGYFVTSYNWMFVMHVIKKKNCCLMVVWSVRWIMDVSYLGRFVPKTIHTQVGRFVPSGLDVSYPKSGKFIPKGWTFRTQGLDVSYPMAGRSYPMFVFLIFCIWLGVFASKIVRLIQPIECWSIRTHFLFISHTWFGLFFFFFFMYLFTNVWFFSSLTLQILRYKRLSPNWVKY